MTYWRPLRFQIAELLSKCSKIKAHMDELSNFVAANSHLHTSTVPMAPLTNAAADFNTINVTVIEQSRSSISSESVTRPPTPC